MLWRFFTTPIHSRQRIWDSIILEKKCPCHRFFFVKCNCTILYTQQYFHIHRKAASFLEMSICWQSMKMWIHCDKLDKFKYTYSMPNFCLFWWNSWNERSTSQKIYSVILKLKNFSKNAVQKSTYTWNYPKIYLIRISIGNFKISLEFVPFCLPPRKSSHWKVFSEYIYIWKQFVQVFKKKSNGLASPLQKVLHIIKGKWFQWILICAIC